MYSPVLAQRVRELKETPEGGISMCEEMEKIYSEGRTEGRLEGRESGLRETAVNMLADGLPVEKVSAYSGLPVREVEAIQKQIEQYKK